MFNNILVAVDGSDMSNKAFDTALVMAKQMDSKMTIINVGKMIFIPDGMAVDSMNQVYEAMAKAGEEILKKEKWKAESQGVTTETYYVEGDPAAQIIKKAKEGHYQLIVIGNRGFGTFKELMLGSVSHKVSQMSPCPVLIVK